MAILCSMGPRLLLLLDSSSSSSPTPSPTTPGVGQCPRAADVSTKRTGIPLFIGFEKTTHVFLPPDFVVTLQSTSAVHRHSCGEAGRRRCGWHAVPRWCIAAVVSLAVVSDMWKVAFSLVLPGSTLPYRYPPTWGSGAREKGKVTTHIVTKGD